MITASELRIGNLVFLTKNEFKTKKVYDLSGIDIYKVDESNCQDIQEIPLSEAWLSKFGFERIVKDKKFSTFSLSGFKVSFSTTDFYDMEISTTNIFIVNTNRIRSVHQLQNFFHAITGKELSVMS